MRFYENSPTLLAEQDQFEKDIQEFIRGKINPVKFKAIRVAHGVYEQRQEHTYMIRIRCAASGITPEQLKKVAELGDKYGSGEVHFTTRQEVQVHNVLIQNVMTVIRGLNEVDLSSRGGGGNTIRNILTSPLSGVEVGEEFDVDPYAIALTTRLINEPDSWNLPRKFKIAFSNGPSDTAFTQATCLGYVAKVKDGKKGFQVFCAGGMGARPMVGNLLFDWIDHTHTYHIARALKTMFDKHGNRRSKNSNRLKFLWRKLDRNEFVSLFEEEFNKIKDDRSLDLDLPEIDNTRQSSYSLTPISVDTDDFNLWKNRYVTEQKQAGLYAIKLPLRLGDLLKKDADKLCDLLSHFGDNTIRCDRAQNMRLRNIPEEFLGNVYTVVTDLSYTLVDYAPFIGNMINCTGAQTCKLGICLPRGLSDAIRDKLSESQLNLDRLDDFRLNMSGCPNTCGMHHIAHLGFFGKIGRNEGQMYPAYNVLVGAKVGHETSEGQTEYAKKVSELPAHYVPSFVHDFLENYLEEKDEYTSYYEYLDDHGIPFIENWSSSHTEIPSLDKDSTIYKDFGAKRILSLDEMGTAECSAGMFDMINVDKKYIEDYTKEWESSENKETILQRLLFHTSRMLLVTRGIDANEESKIFELFGKHFVTTGLVNESYLDIVTLGKLNLTSELISHKEKVFSLSRDVLELYKNMDDSLRFNIKSDTTSPEDNSLEKDYRGVACPMNFVKTKLVLESMRSGQTLAILLDDGEPIQNVPNSVKLEGHTILSQEKQDEGYWKVSIKKK
jgi:sulfite reductase (ferredoxin)